ncbi:aspartate ammonia-lyase [Leptolinea tardivitalis]|nr:aspartate ammonia-lyase [Leptolinea tardivitalis]GAP20526.1 aspartate ammonia-lyase [Leptolinea tardivitalis]
MMTEEKKYRIEKDSLGEINVPADMLYGAQTQRAVENFPISGYLPDRAFIWSIAVIKLAAARVNLSLGLLLPPIAEAIQDASKEIMEGKWDKHFVVDPFQAGAGTSHHMNINEVTASRANQILEENQIQGKVHPNDHVNMAQSTNDVIPTAIRLGCLWRLNDLDEALLSAANAFTRKSVEFDNVIKSGRTHLQDAVPVRLGQEFSAYASAIQRDRNRILEASEDLGRLGIGGTAAGTGLNAHPDFASRMVSEMANITGFSLELSENLFESMQSMADFTAFSGALRTCAVTFTKIANDLRLLSSGPASGLDEIHLPAVQPGSSIMPGKVNPVMAEMLNMVMIQVCAMDTAVALASGAGQLELNVMMPSIAYNLFEMMKIMTSGINAFTNRCVDGISANPERCRFWLERNTILVTALNPIIGYQAGAKLAQEARRQDVSILAVAEQQIKNGQLSRLDGTPVTLEEIKTALQSVDAMTRGGLMAS